MSVPLEEHLDDVWRRVSRGRDFGVDRRVFLDLLGETVLRRAADGDESPVAVLDRMAIDDLYLAQGCAAGNHSACREFEKLYGRELDRMCLVFATRTVLADDARQELLSIMFLGRGNGGLFQRYRGISSLQGWLRVSVRHVVIDLHRGRDWRPIPGGGNADELPTLADRASAHDHHGVAEKATASVFARLVAEVLAEIEPAERATLVRYYRDGVTLDQLGREQNCHAATVHRHLRETQTTIRKAVLSRGRAHAGLRPDDVPIVIELMSDLFRFP